MPVLPREPLCFEIYNSKEQPLCLPCRRVYLRKAVRVGSTLRRNGICVLPTNMGMAFYVANLRRNGIFVLPTYVGVAFVCS
jgi:hypothetical protein